MIDRLFPSRRSSIARRRRIRVTRVPHLDIQPLEARIALAIDVFQFPMNDVDEAPNNFAVLVLDQGDAGFLKKNATPSPSFTFANNSQFLNSDAGLTAINIGALFTDWGALTNFYVTSGKSVAFSGDPLVFSGGGDRWSFGNAGNEIDIGTNDGIVPGTFSAILTVTSEDAVESGLVFASSPGAEWNLNFGDDLDSLKPARGRISSTGRIQLEWDGTELLEVTMAPLEWAVYTGAPDDVAPLSFTVSPGQTLTQSMIIDLTRVPSSATINSPLLSEAGPGATAPFFSPAGSVTFAADSIFVNANTSSTSRFAATAANLTVNRPVAAPLHSVRMVGSPSRPGQLIVSEQGALAGGISSPATTGASSVSIQAQHADVTLAGVVNAIEQTYLLQSPLDPRAYTLTTVSPSSGTQTGRIIGKTVGMTLANDAGGEVNVRTTIDELRMTASSTAASPALPYAITVAESDDLTVDAVPASRRPIAIDVAGTLSLTSSVQTSGDLSLAALNQLKLAGAISSAGGSIGLVSDSIVSTGPITAGGTRSVSLLSRTSTGDVSIDGLVRAGGATKVPVRAATTANVDLTTGGLLTIDGVVLVAGDRVLVKNQDNPAHNGIYVAVTGSWSRAADANTAQLLVPGFTVAVLEGMQEGNWTFANAASPTLDQTGLLFVPASATQTYVPVRVATTANVNLSAGGLLPIDGVQLAVDDRVLVRNQSNQRQNGLYVVSGGPWVRASDADTVPELLAGSYVFVTEGATNGGKGFVLTNDAVQVGGTPLTFDPFVVQPTRTNTYSPANVLTSVAVATTIHVNLAAPPTVIDGVVLVNGNLVLVKNQFDAASNGVYEYQNGLLQRWVGATSASELARGTVVFVNDGATYAGTSWTFNDSVDLLARTTAGSQLVSGLSSTLNLAAGMLVTGPGIPSGTLIDIVIDGTSIRLTKPALITSSTTSLRFMQTASVAVGVTPLLFVPTGGGVTVTAGRSITSSTATPTSRITGSSALLSAGRPQIGTSDAASLIAVNSAVGRLSAIAPASIDVTDSGTIDLIDVKTLLSGGVKIGAQGTLTARSLTAVGDETSPADVTLSSVFGDVVLATVTSAVGSINVTSVNERAVVRRLGLNAANVAAQNGDVNLTADIGGVRLEGPVRAGGTDGDVSILSSSSGLFLLAPATIQAQDRLTVITPNTVPSLAAGTTVTARALSITSQFGAAKAPPAGFGTFSTLDVNRTDPGDIDMTSTTSLTIEGASTVNGSILFTAPSVGVVGPVTSGTETAGDGDVTLTATTGSVTLAANVTARSDAVRLNAPQGSITQTAGVIDAAALIWTAPTAPTLLPGNTFTSVGLNLTAPGDVRIPTSGSQSGPLVLGRVTTVDGNIVVDADSVVITRLLQAGGAGKSVSVTARAGGISFADLGRIEQPSGPVTLSAAAGAITNTNVDKVAYNVYAPNSLSMTAASGVDLRTAVASLSATVSAGDLVIDEGDPLVLTGVTARDIRIRSRGNLTQTAPIIGRSLDVGAGSLGGVLLDNPTNDVNTLTVSNAGRQVRFTDADDLTIGSPGIVGRNVYVTTGSSLEVDAPIQIDGTELVLTSQGGNVALDANLVAPGATVTVNAGQGTIAQAAGTTIDSRAFIWFATAQPTLLGSNTFTAVGINLTSPGNVRIPASGSQPGTLEVAGASTVDGTIEIDADAVVVSNLVRAGGAGTSATITARTGNISFVNGGRIETASGLVTLSATSGLVSLVNGSTAPVVTSGGGLTIASSGTVPIGTATAAGPVTITTSGGVDVGPQAYGRLESTTSIDLRSVAGTVAVRNGGRIVAPTVLLAPGRSIQVQGASNITTAAALEQAIFSINALPAIPGSPYELVVAASFALTQPLVVTRPITLRGTSQSIVLSGSPTATSGLLLDPGSSGSVVRNIAFSSFAAEAIRLNNVQNVSVTGIRSGSSEVGIAIYGTSNGSVVQGSTFDRNTTGVKLGSATGVLVGGNASGQPNTISNSVREGIFASGFCTGSQLVKNRITGRATAYNVAGSRGLTIVR